MDPGRLRQIERRALSRVSLSGMRKFDDIQTQLNTIQQQIAPVAPVLNAKRDEKAGKGHKGR